MEKWYRIIIYKLFILPRVTYQYLVVVMPLVAVSTTDEERNIGCALEVQNPRLAMRILAGRVDRMREITGNLPISKLAIA